MNRILLFCKKILFWFHPKYENRDIEYEYNELSKKENRFLIKATSIGLLLHLLYICVIVFSISGNPLYSYINLLCVNTPITIFVAIRYLMFNPKSMYINILCDIITGFHSIMWASGSLFLSLLCYLNYTIGDLCVSNDNRPISLGIVFYATFGVIITLLVFKINKIIMAIVISFFSIYFIVIWCYIKPMPYISLLPCLFFYLYSFIFANSQETKERSIFNLALEYKNESELRKKLQKKEKITEQKSKQFVNYVFHETRVALNTVTLNWQLIENEITRFSISSDSSDAKNSIHIGLKSLESILNDILDLRKMQDGNFSLNINPFDVNKCIQELKISQQNICNMKKVKLCITLDPKINNLEHLCLGDKNRIRQIVSNFLSNAVKFTNAGGTITIKTILESTTKDSVVIFISVTDNGIGISISNQKKLFKNFSQVSPTLENENRNPKGTGLGMAIVASIVESHSGEYGVLSQEKQGSTFWVKIPFKLSVEIKEIDEKNMTPSYERNIRTIKNYQRQLHILVVDDEISTRKVMKKIIENLGHKCDKAQDGSQALNLLNKNNFNNTPFDIILTDVQMPIMDGIEFISQARKQGFTIPIIILSGDNEEHDYTKVKANGNLIKPVSIEKLQYIINLVINI